ncbi:MAG: hypothetical protein RLZZ630_4 [Bacteroidota bacterium]
MAAILLQGFIRNVRVLYCALVVFCFLLPTYAFSHTPDYQLFNETNGLRRSYINDIYRDKEGYFWLATEKGIIRFDGLNFVALNEGADDPAAIPVELFHPYREKLYFTGVDKDAFYLDLNNYTIVRFYQGPIADVYPLGPDRYCVLTKRGLLKFFQGDKLTKVLDFDTDHAGRLSVFNRKLIVAAPDRGVYAVDTDRMVVTDTADLIPSSFNSRFVSYGDQLYLSSIYTTYRFESLKKLVRVEPVPGSFTPVSYFKPTPSGRTFYITQGKSLYSIQNGEIRHFELDLLQNLELRCLLEDAPGDVLLGTNQGLIHFPSSVKGLSRIDDNFLDANGPLRVRRKVLQGPDSTVLLFGTEYNYILRSEGVLERMTSVKMSVYDAVRVGRDFYMGTEGQGLVRIGISTGKVENVELNGIVQGQCYGLYLDSKNSRLLIGTIGQLLVMDLLTGRSYALPVGNEPVPVKTILKDTITGDYWIGAQSGLFKLGADMQKAIQVTEKDGTPVSLRCDDLLIIEERKEIWVATDKGARIFDLTTGLPKYDLPQSIFSNPRIVTLLRGPLGKIWMGTYSGIVAYDPETGNYIRLEKKNGLMNQEFNYKSAARLDNGLLVFGGLNGYDVIDPSKIEFAISPRKGFINGFHLFSRSDTVFAKVDPVEGQILRYELESQHLRLYLSSAELSNASRYTFEYSLDGSPWIRLGGNAFIDLFWLEYGSHTLKCRAFNEFGTIIEYFPITIIAQIPFYETSWFLWTLTGIAFVFLVLLIMAINYRRRSEHQLKEKISMDLHDEVGTMLTRTLYQSREIKDPALRGRVTGSLNAALFSLRVFIHTISKRVLFLQNLMDEVADLLTKTFSSDDFRLEWSFKQDRNYVASPELYRDIKLVMFELVNNVMKHADASKLKVMAEAYSGKLKISVEDNGPATTVPEEGSQGNGLRNIRRRIERHNGGVDININSSGHGFRIEINVPL